MVIIIQISPPPPRLLLFQRAESEISLFFLTFAPTNETSKPWRRRTLQFFFFLQIAEKKGGGRRERIDDARVPTVSPSLLQCQPRKGGGTVNCAFCGKSEGGGGGGARDGGRIFQGSVRLKKTWPPLFGSPLKSASILVH